MTIYDLNIIYQQFIGVLVHINVDNFSWGIGPDSVSGGNC
jgi:hypothetical protein